MLCHGYEMMQAEHGQRMTGHLRCVSDRTCSKLATSNTQVVRLNLCELSLDIKAGDSITNMVRRTALFFTVLLASAAAGVQAFAPAAAALPSVTSTSRIYAAVPRYDVQRKQQHF
jgi:hypothetical protein